MDSAAAANAQLQAVKSLLESVLLNGPTVNSLQPSAQRAETLLKTLGDFFEIEKHVSMPTGLPAYSKTAHFFTEGLDVEQTWNLLHAANHELLKPVKKLAYKVCAAEGTSRSLFALTNLEQNMDDFDASDRLRKPKAKDHKVKFARSDEPTKISLPDEDHDVNLEDDEETLDDELSGAPPDSVEDNPFRNRSSLPVSSVPKKTQVDDKFFHLQEMDQYLQWVEERDNTAEGGGVDARFDLFTDINQQEEDAGDDTDDADDADDDTSDSEHASGKPKLHAPSMPQYRYDDFFDKPPTTEGDRKAAATSHNRNATNKSSHEQQQARIEEHVRNLEADRLEVKEWHLRGEVQARERPENSVLEKFVEFEHMSRGAPVITELTTHNIENLVRQRIKDQIWDNVERKVKPAQVDAYEFKKRLLLDQEKPKQSLAQIYEQDYLRKAAAESGSGLSEAVPGDAAIPAHSSIRQKMKTLFMQLDALSNFTFAPRPVAPEIKLQPAAPAYEREEVNVLAVADSNVLAPEELHRSMKRGGKRSELMAADERTETDRKRELRKKKLRQGASAHAKTDKNKEDEQESKRKAAKHAKFALNTSTQFFERLQKHVQKEVGEKKMPAVDTAVPGAANTGDGGKKRSSNALPSKITKKVKSDGMSSDRKAVALKFG